jgi:hypothetical protein
LDKVCLTQPGCDITDELIICQQALEILVTFEERLCVLEVLPESLLNALNWVRDDDSVTFGEDQSAPTHANDATSDDCHSPNMFWHVGKWCNLRL